MVGFTFGWLYLWLALPLVGFTFGWLYLWLAANSARRSVLPGSLPCSNQEFPSVKLKSGFSLGPDQQHDSIPVLSDKKKFKTIHGKQMAYVEHRKYLFALFEELGVNDNVTLVTHDWGSGLGFHWAHTHPSAVKGIVFMEAIVAPIPSYDQFPEGVRETFQVFRSPKGEEMVLQRNMFVEGMLPGLIIRKLTDEEMNEYRRPYVNAGEDRRPTLTWPRQVPIGGDPADVTEIVSAYGARLSGTRVPKLLINAEPGALIVGAALDCVRTWPKLTKVTVPGIHFVQEDSPNEIGKAIRDWRAKL